MTNNQLEWVENTPTLLQPGILIAQGIRRVYCIDSALIGDNRFRAGIRRGCFVYWCNLPADKIEDAKSILQHDHDSIHESIAEACEEARKEERDKLLSIFACQIGGWNATHGVHAGRLVSESNYDNDDEIVHFLLETFKSDVTRKLKEEIVSLKSQLFDASPTLPESSR